MAWQVANEVARAVLGLCRTEWKPHAAGLFGQLQRASLSVQLNIAEGYAVRSRARFSYHLVTAYGSAVETTELLELALAEHVAPPSTVQPILIASRRAQSLLLGLLHRYREVGGER